MKSLEACLAQVRADAAECLMLASLATDKKSVMFVKMGEHLSGLASEIEKTIAASGPSAITATLRSDESATVPGAEDHNGAPADVRAPDPQGIVPANVAAPRSEPKRSHKIFAWLLLIIAALVAGSFLWANGHLDRANKQIDSFSSSGRSAASRDHAKQAIADLLSSERSERKVLTEGLAALSARIDQVVSGIEDLKKAASSAEIRRPPAVQSSPSTSEERPLTRDRDQTDTVQAPTKPPEVQPPPKGLVGRIGTSAEPDEPRKLGAAGCEHFRSFDTASGTYVTLDGRRRPCR